MSDFEKFKEEFPGKEKFYISLQGKNVSEKECIMLLRFGTNLK